ncbi:hypothetical protein CC78DRAFT_543506 [Lojkania enalia]|uniref:Uncharacterized protein n=1 Tax=Lojkania enalia TaxID=147567 RepID=A0A9P4KBL2_9PLEO|nr:hypothetical protein CC78DRAFT_543506 [Didymosphaeria enalia]
MMHTMVASMPDMTRHDEGGRNNGEHNSLSATGRGLLILYYCIRATGALQGSGALPSSATCVPSIYTAEALAIFGASLIRATLNFSPDTPGSGSITPTSGISESGVALLRFSPRLPLCTASDGALFSPSTNFGFVIHLGQELNAVLVEGVSGKGYLGGIAELQYKPQMALIARLIMMILFD